MIIVNRDFLDELTGEVVFKDNHDGTITLYEFNGAFVGYQPPKERKNEQSNDNCICIARTACGHLTCPGRLGFS